jgi:hydroxymethylbilane synthase
VIISTHGDRVIDKPLPTIGGKGLFTSELENALINDRVDAAVHSLKDLPTDQPEGLQIGAITHRSDARDILFSPQNQTLDQISKNSIIGTSSLRRKAQLLAYRPDLIVKDIRGNVDTRINKTKDGNFDAIVLAAAGLLRLGLEENITQYLPLEIMLPAPGQGALAIQCRSSDQPVQKYLKVLNHFGTNKAVEAERSFLKALGGGCALPVGAYAQVHEENIEMQVVIASLDGQKILRLQSNHSDPVRLGISLAKEALNQGAREILQ